MQLRCGGRGGGGLWCTAGFQNGMSRSKLHFPCPFWAAGGGPGVILKSLSLGRIGAVLPPCPFLVPFEAQGRCSKYRVWPKKLSDQSNGLHSLPSDPDVVQVYIKNIISACVMMKATMRSVGDLHGMRRAVRAVRVGLWAETSKPGLKRVRERQSAPAVSPSPHPNAGERARKGYWKGKPL